MSIVWRALRATSFAAAALLGGCAGGPGFGPGEPTYPPPAPAWRPGEAAALLLRPPTEGARPIDDAHLRRTAPYRARIAAADAREADLRRIEKNDPGGRRTWYLDGPEVLYVRFDLGGDGVVDQTQYFGEEGLYAVVHRFAEGRRVQRIFWPPGEPRIVEIRDVLPPYPGVWWRTPENPFPASDPTAAEGSPGTAAGPAGPARRS